MKFKCKSCGINDQIAVGLCKTCYDKMKYCENKTAVNARNKKWRLDHPREVKANNKRHRDARGVIKFTENKKCGAYLGVHVAERVLSKVFKNVTRMNLNHKGYDFICGKGKKIDVKSSCLYKKKHSQTATWGFHIRYNTIADYFLCLAFDNRDDLNPLHMWLLPANKFNDKSGIGISNGTINKWDEYKLPIEKVLKCCDSVRRGGN